jgi:signal peptidase I
MLFKKTKTGEVNLGDNPVLNWQRRLRKAFFVLIAIGIVWFFVQIGRYTVAAGNDAMKGIYPPKMSVAYDRLFDWHSGLIPFFGVKNRGILRENVVIFLKNSLEVVNPKTGERTTGDYYGISRVVGLPGDTIRYVPEGILVSRTENGNTWEKLYPAPHSHGTTEPQEIPPDRFYVLNDNVASDIQDSRQFGYVLGEELRGKVLGSISFW